MRVCVWFRYIVTSRMDQDLQSIVFSKTALSEDQTQWILYQCLAGLNYLHSAGVVHRDLKPGLTLLLSALTPA